MLTHKEENYIGFRVIMIQNDVKLYLYDDRKSTNLRFFVGSE